MPYVVLFWHFRPDLWIRYVATFEEHWSGKDRHLRLN